MKYLAKVGMQGIALLILTSTFGNRQLWLLERKYLC